MHPAYSVILFTTASGAGYGLLVWLSLLILAGAVPGGRAFALASFGLALTLVTLGLLASTFHLGRPERAWRAFSQWRSSWLSREGIAALATYVPATLMALEALWRGEPGIASRLLAPLAIAGALATVYCTGMIYASLRTIRQWNQPTVPLVYLALALASGALLLDGLLATLTSTSRVFIGLTLLSLVAALLLKLHTWRRIDATPPRFTTEAATGLGRFGSVRPLDPPHTQPNFVMREMGYRVARQHAEKLRRFAVIFAFLLPLLLTLPLLAVDPGPLPAVLAWLAAGSAAVGLLVERWLFFAEAEHVAMVYYGAPSA
jgi:DMSO reductase anchor subunit